MSEKHDQPPVTEVDLQGCQKGMHARFTHFYFQLIFLLTALLPFFFSGAEFLIKLGLSIAILWGWLAVWQMHPLLPEFERERKWIIALWKSGGVGMALASLAFIIYLPIFLRKDIYFWGFLLMCFAYYVHKYVGD